MRICIHQQDENRACTTKPNNMITKATVQQDIIKYANKIEYDGTSTSHVAFMTIFLAILRDNDVINTDSMGKALAIWDSFPKNPSAFKQDVEKWLSPTTPDNPSTSASKYLDMI